MPRALASVETRKFEQAVASKLGIPMDTAKGGTLSAEYNGGDTVLVTWECLKVVPLDEFNEIMREAQA